MPKAPPTKEVIRVTGNLKADPATKSGTAEVLWSSLMEKHPKHAHAIGMLSIEIAEMEFHLARLLGRLISSTPEVAEAIYFTYKAAMPRIDLLENVAPVVLANNPVKRKAICKATTKARALMGQRHNLIHNRFEVDGPSVVTIRYENGKPKRVPVELKQLTNLIREIRRLNIVLIDLTDYGATGNWLESSP